MVSRTALGSRVLSNTWRPRHDSAVTVCQLPLYATIYSVGCQARNAPIKTHLPYAISDISPHIYTMIHHLPQRLLKVLRTGYPQKKGSYQQPKTLNNIT